MTETALAELLSRNVSGLDVVALMIDGAHFAESCCVVALGIGIDGVRHPLSAVWTDAAAPTGADLPNHSASSSTSLVPAQGGGNAVS